MNYLNIYESGTSPSGKTKKFKIVNLFGNTLGEIKWHGAWRKYCYFNHWEDTIYDVSCLKQITEFIEKLMEERTPPASEAEPGGKISPCTTVTEEKIVKQEGP